MSSPEVVVKNTCQAFRGHVVSAGLKNRNRDRAANEYFGGAAQAFHLSGDKSTAAALAYFIAFGLAAKGYAAVEDELKEAPVPGAIGAPSPPTTLTAQSPPGDEQPKKIESAPPPHSQAKPATVGKR